MSWIRLISCISTHLSDVQFFRFDEIALTYGLEAAKLETDSVKYYFWLSMFESDKQKQLAF